MDSIEESAVELNAALGDTLKSSNSYLCCLKKAMERTHHLLREDVALQDYQKIHSAKSILYAAVEQMGMRADRIISVQRMLRELLSIVASQYNSPGHDKQVGLQILDDLKARMYTIE